MYDEDVHTTADAECPSLGDTDREPSEAKDASKKSSYKKKP